MYELLYITKCLQQIEAKLNWGDRHTWVYDDFKRLQDLIFESSNTSLSIHTLERLFGKLKTHKNYNPQIDTKNALAIFLEYDNWNHFRTQNPVSNEELLSFNQVVTVNDDIEPILSGRIAGQPTSVLKNEEFIVLEKNNLNAAKPVAKPYIRKLIFISGGVLLLLVAGLAFYNYQSKAPISPFSINFKVLNQYGHSPHTVKVLYNLPRNAQSTFILDFGVKETARKISEKNNSYFKTYINPGVFNLRLKENSKTLAQTKVFINSQGWLGYFYDVYEADSTRKDIPPHLLLHKNDLHTNPEHLSDTLKGTEYFIEYLNINDFKVNGDNSIFETRFRSNVKNGGELCNDMWFKLIGTQGTLKMHFLAPGCFGYVQMIFGEKKLNGYSQNLSALARKFSDWKKARMEVVNKQVAIYFEDKLIYKTAYSNSVGKIMAISITSKGAGETDYVKLYTADKKLVYADNFEQCMLGDSIK